MDGRADPEIAARAGDAPGDDPRRRPRASRLCAGRWPTPSLFDELRVDPYYRTIARAHPDLAPRIEALIAAMDLPEAERTLVLGDFSPKNILVHARRPDPPRLRVRPRRRPGLRPRLLPQPPAAQGDPHGPAAPAARPRYLELIAPVLDGLPRPDRRPDPGGSPTWCRGPIEHTAACLLARVDGKSPVEYLDRGRPGRRRGDRRSEPVEVALETWRAMPRARRRIELPSPS